VNAANAHGRFNFGLRLLSKLHPPKEGMLYWVAGHLTGGLGNRLFQHAAAMGLAEKWSRPVVFSLPHCAKQEHGPFDNIFRLFPSVPIMTEEQHILNLYEPNGHVFTYTPFQSDPVAANMLVDGWRQTDKYFPSRGVHAELEKAISNERQTQLLTQYGLLNKREETAFLHVRLGDYKILPHHQIDIGAYISQATKHFQQKTRFLVFSDEAKQYKELLEQLVLTVGHIPVVVDVDDELETLFLMSQCWRGAIVANSTFSWWGAYFARQRCSLPSNYIACYPDVWGNGLPIARDIVPSWGIRVRIP
jgi:hypothetical protein